MLWSEMLEMLSDALFDFFKLFMTREGSSTYERISCTHLSVLTYSHRFDVQSRIKGIPAVL